MSSRQPRETVFFLDRSLGRHLVADMLRSTGLAVEVHDDHLPIDAPDEDWISLVGHRGWIAVTKDKNIRYRTTELASIKRHRAIELVVRAKNTTGADIGSLLSQSARKLQNYVSRRKPPLVFGIDRSGRLSEYEI